jgi:hypothetical protein
MRSSEKMLAAVAGGLLLALLGYVALSRAVLTPANDLDRQAEEIRREIDRIELENARLSKFEERFRKYAARTFDTDELRASELARSHLVGLIQRSGLGASELVLKPFNVASPEPGVYKEIGWFVRLRGKLDHVVNFLYLAAEDPYLHRLQWQSISPVAKSPDVELHVRYSTLVLGPPARVKDLKDIELEANRVADALDEVHLDGPQRQRYDLVVERDLFRPYVPRPPEPPAARTVASKPSTRAAPSSPRPQGPAWSRMRVVGLPSWGGKQDVFLRDPVTGDLRRLQPGDDLAGGVIAMVDYRPMPMPNKPEIVSSSRLILYIGREHWAVELGQTLAEKRILNQSELPEELRSAPAPGVAEGTATEPAAPGKDPNNGAGEGE